MVNWPRLMACHGPHRYGVSAGHGGIIGFSTICPVAQRLPRAVDAVGSHAGC